MNLSNKLYDKLKFVVQVLIPGIAALYVGLGQVWTDVDFFDHGTQVSATAVVLATFLGLFLTASAKQYDGAGDLVVTTDATDGEVYLAADLNKHPNAFKNKKNVVLNVKHQVLNDQAA
jgi:putative holin Dp-1